ncbi:hypothetical protein [Kutzneria sp. 744]|uniref:hypothetical protein n=1 Tax=Kutzneria sp. (strain 744) TaxID=345341 RepID=UPI0004B0773D|nr:hypothetical protein [Kutzneria sp. 744]
MESRLAELGFTAATARERALQMHTFLLGHVQMVRRGVEISDPVEYARDAFRLLTAP